MNYVYDYEQDLTAPIVTRPLSGQSFTGDQDSVMLRVTVTDNGEPADLSDQTIYGYCVRPDGETIDITGAFSENKAWVVLTSECLELQGRISVTIKASDGTTSAKTTLLSVALTVGLAVTDVEVSGGSIVTDVADLIDAIEDAVETIPPTYTALQNGVSLAFSASHAYRTGDYVMYDGALYRFTQDHAAGSWDANEVDTVAVGQGIAEAFHALTMHNAANVLPSKADTIVASYNGTAYKIHNNVWTISGTTSANFSRNLLKQQYSTPWWLTPGRVLHIRLHKTGTMDDVRLCLYKYTNGAMASTAFMDMSADGDFTIPSDFTADGLLARLYIAKNKTVSGTIEPEIFVGLPNADIVTKIDALDAEVTHYISAPGTTYASLTLADINDNVIFKTDSNTFDDSPVSGVFINRQYLPDYNLNIAVANGSGNVYTRIVKRSDHSVYRDWVQLALKSDVNTVSTAVSAAQGDIDDLSAAVLGRFSGKKIYCEGDSIMVGVIQTYPEYTERTVASPNISGALAARIPVATVDNKAHGGDYIRSMNDASSSICDSLLADTSVSGYDYFVINGGTNDYTNDRGDNYTLLGTIDSADTATFYGAYNAMLQYIFAQNPKARVMLITPCFRNYMHNTIGNAYTIQNEKGITLGDYCDAVIAIGAKYGCPVFDSRVLGPINWWNYTTLLVKRDPTKSGYIHPSQDGYNLYGNAIASFFLANF